jgi:sugar phosphate permease
MSSPVELPEKSSQARMGVLALLCLLTLILYLDRVCMGQAIAPIQTEFGLSNTEISYVLNAFLIAYGLFEVPTGRWGDRFGSRRVLGRVVVWWSLFTMFTAAATGLYSLIVVRFMFGAGEAGAYPNAARIVRRWFPLAERGRVQGLILASAGAGGAMAPVVAGYLVSNFGWRTAFVVFGALGFVWVAAFLAWFRDNPADHPAVNEAELRLLQPTSLDQHTGGTHEPIPWKAALTNRNVWLLGAITCFGAFCSYMFFSWYPKYMQSGRRVTVIEAGWLSSLVLTGTVLGTLSGGFFADWLVRHSNNIRRDRRLAGFTAGMLAALFLLLGIWAESTWATAGLMSLSCFAIASQSANWWSCVTEISGRHVGSLFGLLNACGLPGGILSQYFFGAAADYRASMGYTGRPQWDFAFYFYVVALLIAGVCWLFVDTKYTVEGVKEEPC